jgi:hypothetical protein
VPQPPRGAEIQHPAVEPPVEGQRGITQRAEGDRHRRAADLVVHDFVPDQDLQRVGAGIPADLDRHDRLALVEPLSRFGNALEPRAVDRWNSVLGRAAGDDLGERHGVA